MMNARKSNAIYLTFIITTLTVLSLFIIYAAVRASAKNTSFTIDLNTPIVMNNYKIKVTEPMYLTDKKEFVYALSVIKEAGADDRAKPVPYDFETFSKHEKKTSYAPEYSFSERTDISEYVHVAGVIDDYMYVRVFIESVIPEYRDPPTTDEFGDEIEGQLHEEVKKQIYVQIDKKDVKYLKYDEFLKLKPVDDNDSQTDETSTIFDSDDSKSYDEIDINVSSEDASETIEESIGSSSLSALTDLSSVLDSSSASTMSSETNSGQPGNGGGGGGGNGGGGGGDEPAETTKSPETETVQTEPPATTTTQQTTTTTPTTTTTTTTTTTKVITEPPVVHVDTISIESDFPGNLIKLSIGGKTIVHAVIGPENATNKAVKWSSNREDIAKVDENGEITAVGNGKAIITCESIDGGLKASCMVTVS